MFQERIPEAWRRQTGGRFEPLGSMVGERFSHLKALIEAQEVEGDQLLEAFNLWNKVLRSYGHCQLSYKQDKLVAISGLVKDMQPCIQD